MAKYEEADVFMTEGELSALRALLQWWPFGENTGRRLSSKQLDQIWEVKKLFDKIKWKEQEVIND